MSRSRRPLYVAAAVLAIAAAAAFVWPAWRARQAEAAGARGMAAHAALRYDEALAEYQAASAFDSRDWRWPYYEALVHFERGEAQQAAAALRIVLDTRPDLAAAWWRLGEAEFKQGRFREADAAYARAEQDAVVGAHARRGRARVAASGGPLVRGSAAETRSGAYVPPRDPMVDALADISRNSVFLIRQASAIDISVDPARREKLVRQAVDANRNDPDVVYELGSLLQRLGRAEEALPYFLRHLEMVDDDQQTLVQIGKSESDLGRLDAAEATLRKALAIGDDAVGFYNLGIVLEQRDRLREAEECYRRAVRLNPALASARNNLGRLLAASGRLGEAGAHLADAIRLEPEKPDAYTNLSAVKLQEGSFDEAARLARLAIDAAPRHADAHANLGVALARQGDLAGARREFDEALRLDPRHAAARANRAALNREP